MSATEQKPWIEFNHLTKTYDTKDGTKVAAEVIESVTCLADVLRIGQIRAQQRRSPTGATMSENKKQIVRGFIKTNKVGSRCEFDFEVDAGTPPKQIEEMARDAAFESIEWSYSVDGEPAND